MKALKILENYNTKEKQEYLSLVDSKDPLAISRSFFLRERIIRQAFKVLAGECPHEREIIGSEYVEVNPRDWMRYKKEVPIFSKCKFCGN